MYIPTSKQKEFHVNNRRYKLFGGAVGPGKSAALCNDVISFCLQYRCDFFFGRSTYSDFSMTTEKELDKWLPEGCVSSWNKNKHEIYFNDISGYNIRRNGSRLVLSGCNEYEKLKSLTLGGFAIDELSGVTEDAFYMLCSRLREPSMMPEDYVGLCATNPCQGWVKRFFVDMPERREECKLEPDPLNKSEDEHCADCKFGGCKSGKNVAFIPALASDNPHLPDGYVANLRAIYPKEWVEMLLKGDWNVMEGQVFVEFNDNHIVKAQEIPFGWTKYMCIDPHARTPTHVLWIAVDPSGHKWVYRELAISATVETISKTIRGLEGNEFILTRLIDTSSNVDDELTNQNIMTEFAKNGIHCAMCSKGNEIGLSRMKQSLLSNSISFMEETCGGIIKQIRQCTWDSLISKIASEKRLEPQWWVKRDDHYLDCWKYMEILGLNYYSNVNDGLHRR